MMISLSDCEYGESSEDTSPEIELWRNVIWRIMRDLEPVSGVEEYSDRSRWKRSASTKWRNDAIATVQSRDFDLICEWASMDPGESRRIAYAIFRGQHRCPMTKT
jgi:hypothetical protein